MKTAEIKFLELCDEIDYWKDEAKKAQKEAEYWKNEYSTHLQESLASAQRGVAQALTIALAVTDDAEGNLVIKKKDRKKIAEEFKQ